MIWFTFKGGEGYSMTSVTVALLLSVVAGLSLVCVSLCVWPPKNVLLVLCVVAVVVALN